MKEVSGNPSGQPKGSTNHDGELRRLAEAAILLADNVADANTEAAKATFVEIGVQQLIPLIEAITDNAKEVVLNGEISPSSVASLRHWYEDHQGDADNPSGGAFFAHIDLPGDCSWDAFRSHYTSRRRIDHNRVIAPTS